MTKPMNEYLRSQRLHLQSHSCHRDYSIQSIKWCGAYQLTVQSLPRKQHGCQGMTASGTIHQLRLSNGAYIEIQRIFTILYIVDNYVNGNFGILAFIMYSMYDISMYTCT